jgi:uncharacterized protein YndB with AHSA1/START domain
MKRFVIDQVRTVPATPAEVWQWVGDRATWTTWSPLGTYALERPGADGPSALGSICVFRTGRTTAREEIVEYVPERRLSYALLGGMPLVGYRADVDLVPVGGATEVRWHSEFAPRRRGTGWMYRAVLNTFIGRMLDGLAAHVARQVSAPAAPAATPGTGAAGPGPATARRMP